MATKKTAAVHKRLIRPTDGRTIAGVCQGLAVFFDIDPVIVKLIFIITTVFGGSGLLLYFIFWLIIPSENSGRGLNEINIKDNAKEIGEKARELGKGAKNLADSENSRYLLGIGLLILGVSLTLSNFGFFRFFNFAKLWPLALIFLAFVILKDNGKNG